MSRSRISANSRMAVRYEHDPWATIDRRVVSSNSRLRAGDLEAGRQALEVPLEGPGQRLVEVVDVEDQVPLRRGEAPEVGQVRVSAQLDIEPGAVHVSQIGGHHRGRARGRRRRRTPPSGRSGSGPDRESGWWPGGRGSPGGRCGRPGAPTRRGSRPRHLGPRPSAERRALRWSGLPHPAHLSTPDAGLRRRPSSFESGACALLAPLSEEDDQAVDQGHPGRRR